MQLTLMTPTGIIAETDAVKVIAEASNGFFCLLPRHMDFIATLVPGLLTFTNQANTESLYAINHGCLLKINREVRISTFNAIQGKDLASIKSTLEQQFFTLDEQERNAHSALARLEANTLRRFIQMEKQLHG